MTVHDQREDLHAVREAMQRAKNQLCSLCGDRGIHTCKGDPTRPYGPLHRPLVAGAPMGWICPKCNTANAPTNQTCFACAVREGAWA